VPLLFDASAVANLIVARGSKALATTRGSFSLDLTGYEIGNAIWRLCLLEKKMTPTEASELLGSAVDFLGLLGRISFEELDFNRILKISLSKNLTFYDASYVVAAEMKRLTLVTDDEDLLKAGEEYVSTQRSTETSS
jgi:predicted nucleic acid-binding protein